MLYDLTQGKTERQILQQARMHGYKIPDAIQNAPVLSPGMVYYYTAYVDLMTCRGGMGDGEIPWTAVHEYAKMQGMDNDEFKRLWTLVKKVDLAYLQHREKKMKNEHKT